MDLAENLLELGVVVRDVAVLTLLFVFVFFWNRGQSAVGTTVGWLGLFDKFLIVWTTRSSLTGIVCALHHEELENSEFIPVWVVMGNTNFVYTTDITFWLDDADIAAGRAPKDNEGVGETRNPRPIPTRSTTMFELQDVFAQKTYCAHELWITLVI